MRTRILYLLIASGLFLSPAVASETAGRTAGLTFLKTMNARVEGLGEGFAGVSGGVDSIGINPAGAAAIEFPALSATYLNGFVDDNFGLVNYAHAMSFGSLFAGLAYYDGGSVDLLTTSGVQENRRAQQDQIGQIGFALGKGSPVSFGAAAKFYQFALAETAHASGYAGDAGLIWKTPLSGFSLGGSIQNMGSSLQYEVEKEPLPQVARAGAAMEFDFLKLKTLRWIPYHMLLVTDVVKIKNQDSALAAGIEFKNSFVMLDTIGSACLRGGFNSGTNNFNVGIGFLLGSFDLDYAINLMQQNLGMAHRLTLGWSFTPRHKRKRI